MRREGDKLIKAYLSSPYEYVEQAYQRQKFVHDAGLPVPAVYGVKRVSETETALEMEYIEGKPLVAMYEGRGEEKRIEAMRAMVKLQCRVYAVDASGLPDLTDMYAREITATPYLSQQRKDTLLALMESLGKGKTNLCHGDIHPYNIMYHGDRFWIIDWEDASKGDPAADACMAYFYAMRWAAKGNNRSDEQYLQLFCGESGIPREAVLAWLPVIAGVQVNIEDEEDRAFISNFINDWDREGSHDRA
ncbi:MAG: phosphotransferase [Oscillospiraceae bacterium]|nr:phosphotransferase [Oscillospiraceae bacterium]